jgi:hypothetical protein
MGRVLGPVPEHSTALLIATLRDERGAIIGQSRLSSLRYTLRDTATQTVINGRDGVDILADPALSLHDVETEVVPGVYRSMEFEMPPNDNVLVGASKERHRALLRFSWDGGVREHCATVDLDVYKAT